MTPVRTNMMITVLNV